MGTQWGPKSPKRSPWGPGSPNGDPFGNSGADLHPTSKNWWNGWEVQKLSWNLISYQDWCQTWGFTTFRYLEPPQLMVWKSDFFRKSLRFVRVPPYESWANWTNFVSSWENGDFFGVKTVVPSSTLKMRKSHKKLACVYAYTHAYTQISDGGGKSAPPPE